MQAEKSASFMDGMGHALGHAAVGLGVAGGLAIGGHIYNHFQNNAAFGKMLQLYPELQRENPERVRLYFDTIASNSPSVAQQPLVAGNLIKRMLNYDGFDHATFNDLVSIQSTMNTKAHPLAGVSSMLAPAHAVMGLIPKG